MAPVTSARAPFGLGHQRYRAAVLEREARLPNSADSAYSATDAINGSTGMNGGLGAAAVPISTWHMRRACA